MIYTSTEYENDCFKAQIVKIYKFKNFGVSRSMGQIDHYFKPYSLKNLNDSVWNSTMIAFLETKRMIKAK